MYIHMLMSIVHPITIAKVFRYTYKMQLKVQYSSNQTIAF